MTFIPMQGKCPRCGRDDCMPELTTLNQRIANLEARLAESKADYVRSIIQKGKLNAEITLIKQQMEQSFTAGRKLQREKDALIAGNNDTLCDISEEIYVCRAGEVIAKAIREQVIE